MHNRGNGFKIRSGIWKQLHFEIQFSNFFINNNNNKTSWKKVWFKLKRYSHKNFNLQHVLQLYSRNSGTFPRAILHWPWQHVRHALHWHLSHGQRWNDFHPGAVYWFSLYFPVVVLIAKDSVQECVSDKAFVGWFRPTWHYSFKEHWRKSSDIQNFSCSFQVWHFKR